MKMDFEKVSDNLVNDIHRFIALMFFTTVKFYNFTFKDNENNTDILLEIITSRVIKGKIYIALYNVFSYCLRDQIKKLDHKMQLEENIDFDNSRFMTGVSKIFSFSEEVRHNRLRRATNGVTIDLNENKRSSPDNEAKSTKYKECIKMLWNLKNIENPTDKIQLLVKVVEQIKYEIDQFWNGVDVSQDEKSIDADSMEKLLSYVIVKSKYQKIIVDLQLIDLFSGGNIDYNGNGYIFASFTHTVSRILSEDVYPESDYELVKTPGFKSDDENFEQDSQGSIEAELTIDNCDESKNKDLSCFKQSTIGSKYSLLAPSEMLELRKTIKA